MTHKRTFIWFLRCNLSLWFFKRDFLHYISERHNMREAIRKPSVARSLSHWKLNLRQPDQSGCQRCRQLSNQPGIESSGQRWLDGWTTILHTLLLCDQQWPVTTPWPWVWVTSCAWLHQLLLLRASMIQIWVNWLLLASAAVVELACQGLIWTLQR